MANFAKAQLLKYGWKEGKGLGKDENGITEIIQPKPKFDTTGINYKETNSTNWWERTYDNAVKNLDITSHNDEVSVTVVNKDWDRTFSKKDNKQGYRHINFLKTATLCDGHLLQNTPEKTKTKEIVENSAYVPLTNEQLFKACGGSTMHYAARHGCTLKGKLDRIAKQDKMFLRASTNDLFESQSESEENIVYKMNAGIDPEKNECKIDNNSNRIVPITILKNETKTKMSRNSARKHKRKVNNLVHQLSVCNIKENDTESECNYSDEKKVYRRRKSYKQRNIESKSASRNNLEEGTDNEICQIFPADKSIEKEKILKEIHKHKICEKDHGVSNEKSSRKLISSNKKKSKRERSESEQESASVVIQIDDTLASQAKKLKISHTKKNANRLAHITKEERSKMDYKRKKAYYEVINPTEDEINDICSGKYLPYGRYSALAYQSEIEKLKIVHLATVCRLNDKIRKRKEKRRFRKKVRKLREISQNKEISSQKLDAILKGLTAVSLTEKLQALPFKKRLTQNHKTPV